MIAASKHRDAHWSKSSHVTCIRLDLAALIEATV